MAFGWQYALVAGLSGGALFPFLLWVNNGWANVGTTLIFLFFYVLIGLAKDNTIFAKIKRIPFRFLYALIVSFIIIYLFDGFFFNPLLALNPPFWTNKVLNHLPIETIYGFAFKDSLNLIIITLLSETLLKLNFVRKLFGIPVKPELNSNLTIFAAAIVLSLVVWLIFVGLGFSLLEGNNALQPEHISLAFLVIASSGFLVARMLFNYGENQYLIKANLNKNEAHLNALIDTIPDLVWLKNTDGVYLHCNRRFEEFFGASKDNILGKTDYDFVDKELADFFRNNDKIALAAGKHSLNEEEVAFANDGHSEILETTKTPVFNKEGQIIGVLGIGHNITERKKAEKALQKSEARLSALLSSMKDIIFEIDLNGCFEGYYAQNDKGLLVPPDFFIGKKLDVVLPSNVSELLKAAIAGIYAGNQFEQFEYALTIEHAIQHESAIVSPRYNNAKEIIGFTAVCRNISERKSAEEKLRES
ncbi:MAG TPA: hypothetical protein DCQ31_00965, partial [Bacteroidales bacterium]|nr:hypothetical protein [Bacteroidales bacterium]